MRCDGGLTYNPNTNTLTADRFSGNCLGTAVAINAPTNSSTYIATNGSTRMFVDTAGFVGIGTTSPQNKLDIDAGSSGGIRISSTGATSIYMKSTTNNNNRPELELGTDDNNSYIMTRYDTPLRFITNSVERMRITSDGRVGFGTTSPYCPLHVTTGSSPAVSTQTYGGYIGDAGASYAGLTNRDVVALFSGGWVAADNTAGFIIKSDQRIKSDIVTLNTTSILELYRKLRVVKHSYIDKKNFGNITKYGFIAQEVQKLLPDAVIPQTDFIPSIYNMASIVNHQALHFDNPIKDIQQFNIGTKLKCYDAKNEIVWVTIKEIIDSQNIEIEETITSDSLFIYGHSVDDFLQIDYDPIRNLTTAALQEVDRQQQADKARIAELEATVATQQSLINDILERLKALEKA
jgi:hypothetical protein